MAVSGVTYQPTLRRPRRAAVALLETGASSLECACPGDERCTWSHMRTAMIASNRENGQVDVRNVNNTNIADELQVVGQNINISKTFVLP